MRPRRYLPHVSLSVALLLTYLALSGCLTATTGQSGTSGGRLFNSAPTVVLTADVDRGIVPLTVHFSSVGSIDDGLIVSRSWNFGDGGTSHDISPSHIFTTANTFTVTLTLTDDVGASASKTLTVFVTEAPVAVIKVDRSSAESAPAVFNFDGSASFEPDGQIAAYQWDFGDGSRELLAVVAHTFATPGTYRVRLTVTDSIGVTNSADKLIQVGIPQPTIAFRLPPDNVPNVALSPDSPLWVNVVFDSQPGVPHTIRAGLDGDRDPCDAQAVRFNTLSGDLIQRLTGHAKPLTAVAYSPTGHALFTASQDDTVRSYDLTNPKPDGTIVTPTGALAASESAPITSLAFSPSGATYVYGTAGGAVVLRNAATGAQIWRSTAHTVAVNAVAFSRDGTHVADGADDHNANLYDAVTGQVVQVFGGTPGVHTDAVTSVAFSPANSALLLTGSVDQTAKLWQIAQAGPVRTLTGHTARVNAVAISPDGLLALTGSDDKTARLWDLLGTGGTIRVLSGHTARVNAVAFSPDGKQALTGSSDGTAILWTVATGALVEQLAPCISPITSVAFSPSGAEILLAVAALNDIRLDTDPPDGDDLNLLVPAALNLKVLTPAQFPAQYSLWAEVDTAGVAPVRAYANARIDIVTPFTTAVSVDTPRIPLINDQAAIVLAPTTDRQIFDLGPLQRGDRMFLALLSTPGYGDFFNSDEFSVLVLDADQQMFVWYQSGFILFSPDAKLIIGHDSPHYYVVVDGCRPPFAACPVVNFGQSVSVRMQRQVGLQTREQHLFLNFAGGANVRVDSLAPINVPPFKASDLNPAWVDTPSLNFTQVIETAILNRVQEVYADFDVVVTTSADPTPTPPFQTVYFGGSSTTFFGLSSYIDPRDETRMDAALVATLSIADTFPSVNPETMGLIIGNVAAHEAGHMMGLRHTQGGPLDLMDGSENDITSPGLALTISLLEGTEEFNGQIGIQNAPQLLDETVGPHP